MSRDKHQYGFPFNVITLNIKINDVHRIKITVRYFYTENSTLTDYWKEQKEYWYPKLIEKRSKISEIFADKRIKNFLMMKL